MKTYLSSKYIKLVYGFAAYSWIKTKNIVYQEINDAVNKMLYYSSNDASFLIDFSLNYQWPMYRWRSWDLKYQGQLNDWLADLIGLN